MFRYEICNIPDKSIYQKQCGALIKNIPNLVTVQSLHDVDNSEATVYNLNGHKITVHNSYYVGEVYIESEIDLTPYFS